MLLDPRKLEEILKIAKGPLGALAGFIAVFFAGDKLLTPILKPYMGEAAEPVVFVGSLFAASALLWAAYRAVAKKSRLLRLERFDLRVRNRDDLLGRDEEIANLKGLIDDASLLLVDGESGCGKSSLIAFGLVPLLREDPSACAVVIDNYPGDWEIGLARKIFNSTWSGLSAEERTKIGFADRPAIGSVNAEMVRAILEAIGGKLGRMPIVILDQFDDYQLAAREQFLGRRKDWIKPADLIKRNRTWAALSALVQSGKARLLVVTRSDASAGFHSIRLIDQAEGMTVSRLKIEWLVQWLAQVTADDKKGEVIANPDFGWTDLKKLLERDLTEPGASVGVILPQQVRIVFLGLRKLRFLTPSEYRRAAAGAGVEALYIRDAIGSAAAESGLAEADVRSLLAAFLDHAEGNRVKTRVLPLADMSSIVADEGSLKKALSRLERDEVVREKPASGGDGSSWQLDHDYIARAVLAESRAANKFTQQLQDGAEAWRIAGSDMRQRWRSLLPLSVQVRLAWMRMRSRGRFSYRPYRLYAAFSALRALPLVLVLIAAGWGWREATLGAEVTHILDGLNPDRSKGGKAALELWRASPAVRSRVADRLLESPDRLRDVGADWASAFASVEPDAAKDLMIRLTIHLKNRPNIDVGTQRSLIGALASVGGRLDPREAAKAATDLIARLDRPNIDVGTQRSLIDALASVGGRLDPGEAAKAATDLIARLDGPNIDVSTQRSLIDALASVGGRLDPGEAAKAATDLIARLDGPNIDVSTQRSLIDALASVGGRLDPGEAAKAATYLRARLDRPNIDPDTQWSLIDALASVGGRLDPGEAAKAATDLRARLDRPNIDPVTQRSLINALGRVGGRLDPGEAAKAATYLRARLYRPNIDPDTQWSLISALASVGGRLDPGEAAKAATYLRARLYRPNIDPERQRSLIDALASMAAIPGSPPSDDQINTLRTALGSVAWPLRDPSDSPAWSRLETISGKKFDGDLQRLLAWAHECCRLSPVSARPPY